VDISAGRQAAALFAFALLLPDQFGGWLNDGLRKVRANSDGCAKRKHARLWQATVAQVKLECPHRFYQEAVVATTFVARL
jgi:hypothetical protein